MNVFWTTWENTSAIAQLTLAISRSSLEFFYFLIPGPGFPHDIIFYKSFIYKLMVSRAELGKSLNLKVGLIPKSNSNRPGTPISPRYITIHNTDNTNITATALRHARYLKNDPRVSWHYTVDDKLCVKHLPINEIGWHSGSRIGNSQSIGIEICMYRGINQTAANKRAAILAAILLYDLNLPTNRLVTHYYWTRKNCPRLLLDNGKPGPKWNQFRQMTYDIYNSIGRRSLFKFF